MNPFVFACIAPHGGELIPELKGSNPDRMALTRDSMELLGKHMAQANPDCIVLLTPHGTRIKGRFSIADSEKMRGSWEENEGFFEMEKTVERELARIIEDVANKNGSPSSTINYGTSSGPVSCLPLDWGAIVPLRFMPDVPVVVITSPRDLSFLHHIKFGESLRKAAAQYNKRIGLIASCDWSHTHDVMGPYGFDPAAKELDEQAVNYIKSNQLEEMAGFQSDFIEAAKPDGIWQTLVLAGAIPPDERYVEFLTYEAPTYFGLICAGYFTNKKIQL
ncbi:extradiol ring-cleavage dioxygenase [Mesobacillus jeotgali]|uniref:DODA-type extradiol aromatic ring-opening family dioxygenase n=1 Tax=Mesobacillus jeotgali TaxID=129985 RepID=UPI0009A7D1F2|nr:extradiol ring-cleavage dioxygenase [Mesobacillus jeotgali]